MRTALEQLVDRARHHFLVAGNGMRRYHNCVAGFKVKLPVIALRQACQNRRRLALRTGHHQRHFAVGHLQCCFEGNQHVCGIFKIAKLQG